MKSDISSIFPVIFHPLLVLLLPVVINDIKLEYLCHNKLPGIIFVLMHGADYVISHVIDQTGSLALIDEKVL